mgnify:CR=1 FL=1
MAPEVLATILIIISAFLHASSSAFFRAAGDRLVRSAATGTISLTVGVTMAFFVPAPSPEIWPFLLWSGGLMLLFQLASFKALEYGPLGFIYPISRGMGPVGVGIILFFLFDVQPTLSTVIGVGLVFLGITEMSMRGLRESNNKGEVRKALGFALLTGLIVACYTVIDSRAIKLVENPLTYVSYILILFSVNIFGYSIVMRRRRFVAAFKQEIRRGIPAGMLGCASYICGLLAFRYGGAIEIAALREISIMFSVFIGWWFLGEGIGPRRLLSAFLIASGAIVIKAF